MTTPDKCPFCGSEQDTKELCAFQCGSIKDVASDDSFRTDLCRERQQKNEALALLASECDKRFMLEEERNAWRKCAEEFVLRMMRIQGWAAFADEPKVHSFDAAATLEANLAECGKEASRAIAAYDKLKSQSVDSCPA